MFVICVYFPRSLQHILVLYSIDQFFHTVFSANYVDPFFEISLGTFKAPVTKSINAAFSAVKL